MPKRFRVIAGPNGSGKSTLVEYLRTRGKVDLHAVLNADEIYAEVSHTLVFKPLVSLQHDVLEEFAQNSGYDGEIKRPFSDGRIRVTDDGVQFSSSGVVTSYTVSLLTNFLLREYLAAGLSFSLETVFSHFSKVEALKAAFEAGYRTYLYFVATQDVAINVDRIANRVRQGGHDVPSDKVESRALRSLRNVIEALPYCTRAFFLDNSREKMMLVAEVDRDKGVAQVADVFPQWFASLCRAFSLHSCTDGPHRIPMGEN